MAPHARFTITHVMMLSKKALHPLLLLMQAVRHEPDDPMGTGAGPRGHAEVPRGEGKAGCAVVGAAAGGGDNGPTCSADES